MKDLDNGFGLEGNDLSDNHENKCSDYKVIDNVENIKDGEEGVQGKHFLERSLRCARFLDGGKIRRSVPSRRNGVSSEVIEEIQRKRYLKT